ncbi:MAG: hypothetical protein ACYS22_10580 [Planctomycetota bacterium]|jgi:hypothetical protein
MQQILPFLQQFGRDTLADPYLALASVLGLVTLLAACVGTFVNVRTPRGGVTRLGIVLLALLVLASAGEVMLTYADEKQEERRIETLAEETRALLNDYANTIAPSESAQSAMVALEAGADLREEEVEDAQKWLDACSDRMAAFEARWADKGRRAPGLTPSFRQLIAKQRDVVERQSLQLQLRRGKLRDLTPEEARALLRNRRDAVRRKK